MITGNDLGYFGRVFLDPGNVSWFYLCSYPIEHSYVLTILKLYRVTTRTMKLHSFLNLFASQVRVRCALQDRSRVARHRRDGKKSRSWQSGSAGPLHAARAAASMEKQVTRLLRERCLRPVRNHSAIGAS